MYTHNYWNENKYEEGKSLLEGSAKHHHRHHHHHIIQQNNNATARPHHQLQMTDETTTTGDLCFLVFLQLCPTAYI